MEIQAEMVGGDLFATLDPPLSEAEAQALTLQLFGIWGTARRLQGERDQNFLIRASGRREYLLKIGHSADPFDVVDFQTKLLLYIVKQDAAAPIPRLVPGRDGEPLKTWRASGRAHSVRLQTFLPGDPLATRPRSEACLAELGKVIARLHRAIRGFDHPAARHSHAWDLQQAGSLAALAGYVSDPAHRKLAQRGLAIFTERAAPELSKLPGQVIHNDVNPHNVVVGPDSETDLAVLDFGDALWAPRVVDIAIAMSYHLTASAEPFSLCAALLRAHNRESPLREEEIQLLTPLMCGRLAMTILVTAWRATLHPGAKAYILRNLPAALSGLELLTERRALADSTFHTLLEKRNQ